MTRTRAVCVRPSSLAVVLIAAAWLAGCAAGGNSWKKGQSPQLGTASEAGYYELVTGDQVAARYQVDLGEPLGFRKNSDGRVEAVAGMYVVSLNSTKSYAWRKAD